MPVPALVGEAGWTTLERKAARPTFDLNGIWGGFQGEGTKTVLPKEAHAKITCRLVPNQTPDRAYQLVAAHVTKHALPGVRVIPRQLPGVGDPYYMPADHPANRVAAGVLRDVFGRDPVYCRMGGSVPVLATFLKELGVYSVSYAFALDDECAHAPDEFFRLKNYTRARRAHGMLWERIAETGI